MSKCIQCGNEILTGDIHWEMGLCNNCYNELYKDHKTHISLDKMWLKLAQSFRDDNEKLQDKVADLEAKLAEKDKAIENWQTMYESVMQTCHNDKEEIERLNKQLEEKEKEIEYLTKQVKKFNNEAQKYFEDAYCNDFHNQDKISFAVEKLKETQIYVDNQHFMNARYKCEKKVYADIWNFIDNQIKQLKEQKDV